MWSIIVFHLPSGTLSSLQQSAYTSPRSGLFWVIFGSDRGGGWDGQTPLRKFQLFSGSLLASCFVGPSSGFFGRPVGITLDRKSPYKAVRLPGLYSFVRAPELKGGFIVPCFIFALPTPNPSTTEHPSKFYSFFLSQLLKSNLIVVHEGNSSVEQANTCFLFACVFLFLCVEVIGRRTSSRAMSLKLQHGDDQWGFRHIVGMSKCA